MNTHDIEPLKYGGPDSDDYVTGWNDCCARIAQGRKRRGEPVTCFKCGHPTHRGECVNVVPQPAENSVNLEVAIQAISALLCNDTDWDTSYWNRAVERCVFELNKLRSQQPAEPVYTPSTSTDLGDPIETAIKRFELLAANRNHGAVDPLVGAMELRAYKDSLALQPAEPTQLGYTLSDVHDAYSKGKAEALKTQPAEPVKVPSDTEIRELFLANGFTIKPGHDDLKPYVYQSARALIARCGSRP